MIKIRTAKGHVTDIAMQEHFKLLLLKSFNLQAEEWTKQEWIRGSLVRTHKMLTMIEICKIGD